MSLKRSILECGYTSIDLDEIVHQQHENMAASTNNAGISEQKAFLERVYGRIPDDSLDEEVYEAASRLATATNNDGMNGQVDFLSNESNMSDDDILSEVGESASSWPVRATWSEMHIFSFPEINLWFREDTYMKLTEVVSATAQRCVWENNTARAAREAEVFCSEHGIASIHRNDIAHLIESLATCG